MISQLSRKLDPMTHRVLITILLFTTREFYRHHSTMIINEMHVLPNIQSPLLRVVQVLIMELIETTCFHVNAVHNHIFRMQIWTFVASETYSVFGILTQHHEQAPSLKRQLVIAYQRKITPHSESNRLTLIILSPSDLYSSNK